MSTEWSNRISGALYPTPSTSIFREMYWHGPASIESVKAMDRLGGEAVNSLATARPDAILYGCTATTLVKGRQYDLDLMEEMTTHTGVSVISTTEAILRVFAALNVNSISIASPYPSEIDELEMAFFRRVRDRGIQGRESAHGRCVRHL